MEFEVIRSKRRSIGIEIKQNKLIIRAPMQATRAYLKSHTLCAISPKAKSQRDERTQ